MAGHRNHRIHTTSAFNNALRFNVVPAKISPLVSSIVPRSNTYAVAEVNSAQHYEKLISMPHISKYGSQVDLHRSKNVTKMKQSNHYLEGPILSTAEDVIEATILGLIGSKDRKKAILLPERRDYFPTFRDLLIVDGTRIQQRDKPDGKAWLPTIYETREDDPIKFSYSSSGRIPTALMDELDENILLGEAFVE
jgi:hypothetical protein